MHIFSSESYKVYTTVQMISGPLTVINKWFFIEVHLFLLLPFLWLICFVLLGFALVLFTWQQWKSDDTEVVRLIISTCHSVLETSVAIPIIRHNKQSLSHFLINTLSMLFLPIAFFPQMFVAQMSCQIFKGVSKWQP